MDSYSNGQEKSGIRSVSVVSDEPPEPYKKLSIQQSKYPRWVGQKFEPDGELMAFPGNTLISHLPSDSPLFQALRKLYDELKIQPFSSLYALLPPTSWHMTVFEGVSDHIRKPRVWPTDLPLDCSLSQCTSLFRKKLQEFHLEDDQPFKMVVARFEPLEDGIALKVVPANPAEETRIRRLRDGISETLQVHYPGHETYSFHISISYMLRFLDEHDHQRITNFLRGWREKIPNSFELGVPEFCIFDDMFGFDRQFFLEK